MRIRFHSFFLDFLYVFLRKNAPSAYPFAQSYLWYKAPQITGKRRFFGCLENFR